MCHEYFLMNIFIMNIFSESSKSVATQTNASEFLRLLLIDPFYTKSGVYKESPKACQKSGRGEQKEEQRRKGEKNKKLNIDGGKPTPLTSGGIRIDVRFRLLAIRKRTSIQTSVQKIRMLGGLVYTHSLNISLY
jgi:hypothetical protein